jgi:hypothetical protein
MYIYMINLKPASIILQVGVTKATHILEHAHAHKEATCTSGKIGEERVQESLSVFPCTRFLLAVPQVLLLGLAGL